MNQYRLVIDGDSLEKICWDKFIQAQFPSYEEYWKRFVVPITNRPYDIHAKNNEELNNIGKSFRDIFLSQLHYSILRHLSRVYFVLESSQLIKLDELEDGIIRLCSALDIADDFLQRISSSKIYSCNREGSKNARDDWRKNNKDSEQLRFYRNHLIHGLLMPSVNGLVPKVGKEKNYIDWRKVTNPNEIKKLSWDDFLTPREILQDTWNFTLNYLEQNWKNIL